MSYVEVGTTIIVKSPNYPGNYPANLNCTWTISTVRKDERVRVIFLSLNIDVRGDKLSFYDGPLVNSKAKMTGPMDKIYLDNGNILQPAGKNRPYFSSGKFLTIEMVTNDDGQETSGFQLTATALKKGHTCTYEYPFVNIRLSDHDTHFPHTSRYSYLESPNFGGDGKYFNDIK